VVDSSDASGMLAAGDCVRPVIVVSDGASESATVVPMFTIARGTRVFGIQLPIQAQSSYFVADWERGGAPADMARIARVCDEHGFAYVAVCDHVTIPASFAAGMGTHWLDPIATLGWLAAQTERVRLLSHVYVIPYRQAALAAKQFATLDHLSGGRAICGIGAGHVEAEFERLGVDFHRRGALVSERVPAMIAALEHEFVDGMGATPRPVQDPRPPVWIGGSSAPAIRRAARLADGWLPQGPASDEMVDLLGREREAAGRADRPFAIGHITPWLYVGAPSWDTGADTVAGSPAEVAAGVLASAPAPVNQLQVRFRARSADELADQLAAFATDVAPLVTKVDS
jgi:probable F420-dependent oxidoreductase